MRNLLFMLMLAGLVGVVRAEVPAELLDYVPPGANALAVVDAAQLFGSPLAQRESWAGALRRCVRINSPAHASGHHQHGCGRRPGLSVPEAALGSGRARSD